MTTMPHIKYCDYDKWEMEEYARKKREAEEGGDGRASKKEET